MHMMKCIYVKAGLYLKKAQQGEWEALPLWSENNPQPEWLKDESSVPPPMSLPAEPESSDAAS